MLPSHLLDTSSSSSSKKKRNELMNPTQYNHNHHYNNHNNTNNLHTRLGQPPPPPMPSLCVTGAMCQQGRMEISGNTNNNTTTNIVLAYCIFRPRQLKDTKRPPLVVLHGGPSIPSNYLLPIVNGVIDRTIIFYDQWGCGKSSRPQLLSQQSTSTTTTTTTSNTPKFSIETMVEHLHLLITKQWKLQSFHLLGHSFGGILAYEYLLKYHNNNTNNNNTTNNTICRSVILASAPTSAAIIESESKRLYRQVNNLSQKKQQKVEGEGKGEEHHNEEEEEEENDISHKNVDSNDNEQEDDDDDDDDDDDNDDWIQTSTSNTKKEEYNENFRQTHECRLNHTPLALMDALAQAGPTPWRGIQAISDYQASGSLSSNIPSLILRGEYDFCTETCVQDWNNHIVNPTPRRTILNNCSHYGMLEDERQYGKAITEFLHQQE